MWFLKLCRLIRNSVHGEYETPSELPELMHEFKVAIQKNAKTLEMPTIFTVMSKPSTDRHFETRETSVQDRNYTGSHG